MNEATKREVRRRAGQRCEYCQLHQEDSPLVPLQMEHVIPIKHGGADNLQNLALACVDCNLHKGANLTGIDPHTRKITELFNPRKQSWHDHFYWDETYLAGRTACGRTTIVVLAINSEEQLLLRSERS